MPKPRSSSRLTSERAILGFLLTLAAPSKADPGPSRVAIVESADADGLLAETLTRVRAELTAAGFDVAVLPDEPGVDPRSRVESAGLSPPPVATLALLRTGGGAAADIWVSDRLTHKTLVRHVDVKDVSRDRAPAVLAVRTVELLRASLLEGTTPHRRTEEVSEATPPKIPEDVTRWVKKDEVEEARMALRAEVGAAALLGAPGSPAFGPVLRVGVGEESWSVRISVVAPAWSEAVTATAGRASVRQELALGEVTAGWPADGALAVTGSAGAGALHAAAVGAANPPYVSERGDAWAFAGALGAGGVARLGDRVRLLVDVGAVFTAPGLAVTLAGDERRPQVPLVLGTLGVGGVF